MAPVGLSMRKVHYKRGGKFKLSKLQSGKCKDCGRASSLGGWVLPEQVGLGYTNGMEAPNNTDSPAQTEEKNIRDTDQII